jgi:hypothetical protein
LVGGFVQQIPAFPVHCLFYCVRVLSIGLHRRTSLSLGLEGRMKTFVSLAAFTAGALSQATFEPADFNITEALLKNGVDVSAIPQLAPLAERSLSSGCLAAVSTYTFGIVHLETNPSSVRIPEIDLRRRSS